MPFPTQTADSTLDANASQWGLASKFDFDNPSKWVTMPDVPLLDEHELSGPNGEPEGFVDRGVLDEIAANGNRRVIESGDPATLIVGHTSDDPRAAEKKARGFVVNYKVKPFKRDQKTGQVIYAIHGDFKVRPQNSHILEDYPRRSVELWLHKREIDPIAILGGSTPERDLGVIIRKAREKDPSFDFGRVFAKNQMSAVVLDHQPRTERERVLARIGEAVHYAARGGVKFRYAMGDDDMPMNNGRGRGPGRYADGLPGDTSDLPPDEGDDDNDLPDDDDVDDMGGGEEDPAVAAVLASKPIRDLMDKVNQIFDAVTGGGGGGPPGAGGMGGMDAPGGEPPMGGGMDAPGGQPPMGGMDNEAARFHGEQPVRFGEDDGMDEPMPYSASGFGGPGATAVPGTKFGGKKQPSRPAVKPFSRNGATSMNGTARRPGSRAAQPSGEVVKLKRQMYDLRLRLARADAEKQVAALEAEGVLFGDTTEDAGRAKVEMIELLALMHPQDQEWELSRVRKHYRRREESPVNPAYPGAARYSRADTGSTGDADDYDPKTPDDAMEFADKVVRMGRAEAIKYMRTRKTRR